MKRERLQDQGNKLLQMETLVWTSIGSYCGPRDLQISGHSICVFQWQILTFLHLVPPSKKIGYIHFVKQVFCFILRHWEIMRWNKSRCIMCIHVFIWMWQIDLFVCIKKYTSHQLKPKPQFFPNMSAILKTFCLLCCDCQVEKNLSLEDQLLQALQQSEDYRVRIDNYQSLIQYVFTSICKLSVLK